MNYGFSQLPKRFDFDDAAASAIMSVSSSLKGRFLRFPSQRVSLSPEIKKAALSQQISRHAAVFFALFHLF
jgi:hypothetical protein